MPIRPHLLPCLAGAIAFALASAPAALASGDVRIEGGVLTVVATSPGTDGIDVSQTSSTIIFDADKSGFISHDPRCTVAPKPGSPGEEIITCAAVADAIDKVAVFLGDGNDDAAAEGVAEPLELHGEAGQDELSGAEEQITPVSLFGGPGSDELEPPNAAGGLSDGGPGADQLNSGLSADRIRGGSGTDLLIYGERGSNSGVVVRIGDDQPDGAAGENDVVEGDVEGIIGTPETDMLTGDGRNNQILGFGGADVIDPGGGYDIVDAGEGADLVKARDGVPDRIVCGPDADLATLDEIDQGAGCEQEERSAELQPDRDGDGIDRPADCDDLDAARRPGVFDTPGDGIDQDCSGADAVDSDLDRDGYPAPIDCNDASAAIRPGAPEVLGNPVDENCDRIVDPFPPFTAFALLAARAGASSAELVGLIAADLDGGEQITIACAGKGCKKKLRSARAPASAERLDLAKHVRGLKLRRGARLTVTITRADGVSKRIVFTIARRAFKRAVSCAAPGGGTVARC